MSWQIRRQTYLPVDGCQLSAQMISNSRIRRTYLSSFQSKTNLEFNKNNEVKMEWHFLSLPATCHPLETFRAGPVGRFSSKTIQSSKKIIKSSTLKFFSQNLNHYCQFLESKILTQILEFKRKQNKIKKR